MKKNLIVLILIFIFSLPSVASLFHSGFFQSDDGEWMIIRFSAFFQALSDGQFPVRFLGRLNHEYGYPVANFLYPGFMYLGVPIHVLGFGFVDTIKIIFGVSMVGSVIFCYLWLSRFFDRFSSFIGSLFYLYTPYHLFDLYKRGSVGEVLGLAVLPFILWQIERKSLFWSAIGIGLLMISHNTLALLFLPVIFIYAMLRSNSSRLKIYWYISIFAVGLGLAAFFWIPAFFELQYTVFSQTQISEWQKYFVGLDLIGLSTVAIFVIAFLLFVKPLYSSSDPAQRESREVSSGNSSRQDGYRTVTRQARTINFEECSKLTIFFFVVGILSIFFASSLSYHLWNILPVSFIQFPFRFLSLTTVCVAFLSACVVSVLSNKVRIPLAALLLVILAISSQPFITPSDFFDKGEGFYATNMDTTTVKNEYMPKWVKEKPIERFKEKVEIVEGVGKAMPAGRQVENVSYNSKKIVFDVDTKDDTKVRINTIYYPGWNAFAYSSFCHPGASAIGSHQEILSALGLQNDNKCVSKISINYNNEQGLMELDLPKGENKIELKFSETPLRLFANTLSLLSFVILVFWTRIYKMKMQESRK